MHYMLQAAALLGRRARQAVDPPAGQHSATSWPLHGLFRIC